MSSATAAAITRTTTGMIQISGEGPELRGAGDASGETSEGVAVSVGVAVSLAAGDGVAEAAAVPAAAGAAVAVSLGGAAGVAAGAAGAAGVSAGAACSVGFGVAIGVSGTPPWPGAKTVGAAWLRAVPEAVRSRCVAAAVAYLPVSFASSPATLKVTVSPSL